MKAQKISSVDRIALLGSSRGLGWAVYQQLLQQSPDAAYLLSSRKVNLRANEVSAQTKLIEQDFSKPTIESKFLEQLKEFAPTRLIYLAGGGPHGLFETKKWSDHHWALRTSFLYPAELLHTILSETQSKVSAWQQLSQITFVGSAIAEDKPDPMAASYAAAKHALKGLITSVQKEEASVKPELLLFSPGYMQTDLLPSHSQPRLDGLAELPHDVARKLIAFIEKSD